jgi:hypothetical protein
MHKTIVIAAAALLTGAGVYLAQPPGVTPEMIARALPLEGAPQKAGAMFVGRVGIPCGLCTNSNWDVRSKRIKE